MHARRLTILVALALVLASCTSCASTAFEPRVVPSGPPLTSRAAEELAASTDIKAVASVATSDAAGVRAGILADLRARGAFGARAAELLTVGFPQRTAAIPVLVQGSSVDGTAAVLVVEAWGDVGATLTHRRLWIFSAATGSVLRAASFR